MNFLSIFIVKNFITQYINTAYTNLTVMFVFRRSSRSIIKLPKKNITFEIIRDWHNGNENVNKKKKGMFGNDMVRIVILENEI